MRWRRLGRRRRGGLAITEECLTRLQHCSCIDMVLMLGNETGDAVAGAMLVEDLGLRCHSSWRCRSLWFGRWSPQWQAHVVNDSGYLPLLRQSSLVLDASLLVNVTRGLAPLLQQLRPRFRSRTCHGTLGDECLARTMRRLPSANNLHGPSEEPHAHIL
jgi:hypothetical protein